MRRKFEKQFMKSAWLGSLALAVLALASSAQAADMSGAPIYKGPAPIVAPSWTGFYLGVGVGLRTSRADVTSTSEVVNGTTTNVVGTRSSQRLDGTTFLASPYIGFNWQFAPQWVAGIEGDVEFGSRTRTLQSTPFSPGVEDEDTPTADNLALKTTWGAGLRGRLGYLLTPAILAYATGGGALQHYELISTCVDCGTLSPGVVTNSTMRAGWTIGGGLETLLWSHWLARAEYRYADFGTAPFTIARSGVNTVGLPLSETANFNVTMRTHTVTFGLAYKFN